MFPPVCTLQALTPEVARSAARWFVWPEEWRKRGKLLIYSFGMTDNHRLFLVECFALKQVGRRDWCCHRFTWSTVWLVFVAGDDGWLQVLAWRADQLLEEGSSRAFNHF